MRQGCRPRRPRPALLDGARAAGAAGAGLAEEQRAEHQPGRVDLRGRPRGRRRRAATTVADLADRPRRRGSGPCRRRSGPSPAAASPHGRGRAADLGEPRDRRAASPSAEVEADVDRLGDELDAPGRVGLGGLGGGARPGCPGPGRAAPLRAAMAPAERARPAPRRGRVTPGSRGIEQPQRPAVSPASSHAAAAASSRRPPGRRVRGQLGGPLAAPSRPRRARRVAGVARATSSSARRRVGVRPERRLAQVPGAPVVVLGRQRGGDGARAPPAPVGRRGSRTAADRTSGCRNATRSAADPSASAAASASASRPTSTPERRAHARATTAQVARRRPTAASRRGRRAGLEPRPPAARTPRRAPRARGPAGDGAPNRRAASRLGIGEQLEDGERVAAGRA